METLQEAAARSLIEHLSPSCRQALDVALDAAGSNRMLRRPNCIVLEFRGDVQIIPNDVEQRLHAYSRNRPPNILPLFVCDETGEMLFSRLLCDSYWESSLICALKRPNAIAMLQYDCERETISLRTAHKVVDLLLQHVFERTCSSYYAIPKSIREERITLAYDPELHLEMWRSKHGADCDEEFEQEKLSAQELPRRFLVHHWTIKRFWFLDKD